MRTTFEILEIFKERVQNGTSPSKFANRFRMTLRSSSLNSANAWPPSTSQQAIFVSILDLPGASKCRASTVSGSILFIEFASEATSVDQKSRI
ncbi:hypothetical protein V6Z77_003325 [Aspergillus fumigatus]